MRNIKIYDLTFKRTARFAPECYDVTDESGTLVGKVHLKNGELTVEAYCKTEGIDIESHTHWEISDLNKFHSEERRDKWLTKAAEKIKEVREVYGTS